MDSIIQDNKVCYICGASNTHEHHIFYGSANRRLSEEDGMKVYLCPAHHNMSNNGVHFNKSLDNKLKQYAEKVWIDTYANGLNREEQIELFIKRYGMNYLD